MHCHTKPHHLSLTHINIVCCLDVAQTREKRLNDKGICFHCLADVLKQERSNDDENVDDDDDDMMTRSMLLHTHEEAALLGCGLGERSGAVV